MQTEVVWTCLPFIRSGKNHLTRHSERGKKTRRTEEEVGRQHQGWTGLEFAKSQKAVENREKWRKLAVKSSAVPKWSSQLTERWRRITTIKQLFNWAWNPAMATVNRKTASLYSFILFASYEFIPWRNCRSLTVWLGKATTAKGLALPVLTSCHREFLQHVVCIYWDILFLDRCNFISPLIIWHFGRMETVHT